MSFFSKSQSLLQKKYCGEKVAKRLLQHRVKDKISPEDQELIESSHFFFIASGGQSTIDCSIKSGDSGFVKVFSPTQVCWADYDGNRMYRTLGNILEQPMVSLLFVDFVEPTKNETAKRTVKLRIIGKATIDDSPEAVVLFHGAKRVVKLNVEHVFPNCPRYLPSMEFKEASLYTPRVDYSPPKPEWKTRIADDQTVRLDRSK